MFAVDGTEKQSTCLWPWAVLLCIKSQLIKLVVANTSEQVKRFRSMPCHEYVLHQGQYFTPASWERIYWQTSGAI